MFLSSTVSVVELTVVVVPLTVKLPVIVTAAPTTSPPPTLKVFEFASNVKSASVAAAVIDPDVKLVTTTLCEPEAALNVDPALDSPEPSPTNDPALIVSPVAVIPLELIVTPEPITTLVAVTTPALTIFLLSSIIFEPEILMAIFF